MKEQVIRIVIATEPPVAKAEGSGNKKLKKKIANLEAEKEHWIKKFREQYDSLMEAEKELSDEIEKVDKLSTEVAQLKNSQWKSDENSARKGREIVKLERDLEFFKGENRRVMLERDRVRDTSASMVSDARLSTRVVATDLHKLQKIHEHVKAQAKAWKNKAEKK